MRRTSSRCSRGRRGAWCGSGFSFNLGIEIGKVAFVVAAITLGIAVGSLLATRNAIRRRVAAYAIGSLAAFWVFERLAAML